MDNKFKYCEICKSLKGEDVDLFLGGFFSYAHAACALLAVNSVNLFIKKGGFNEKERKEYFKKFE